jgi:hypothetical protein
MENVTVDVSWEADRCVYEVTAEYEVDETDALEWLTNHLELIHERLGAWRLE